MSQLRSFGLFLYDFVVGDDWRIAAGVVVALAVTGLVSDSSVSAWWVLPVAVAGLLAASLSRELRRRRTA